MAGSGALAPQMPPPSIHIAHSMVAGGEVVMTLYVIDIIKSK
jgi:hypothetical protein